DTIGSVTYAKVSLAAFLNAALTSSTVTSFFNSTVKSTIEPVTVGTRRAVPSNLPFKEGITRPIALAAPVDEGIIDSAAARPRRDIAPFLCGWSINDWSLV